MRNAHIERLIAYVLPNVVRLLEPRALGLPAPLKRLAPREGAKLAAVLAREIARFCELEMLHALRNGGASAQSAELIRAMRDSRQEQLTEERRVLSKKAKLVEDNERALTENAFLMYDRSDPPPKGAQLGIGPYGMQVCWRYDLWPKKALDDVRAGLKGCVSRKKRLTKQAAACDSSIHKIESAIMQSQEFKRKRQLLRRRLPMLLDFSRPGFWLTGALELLIDYEPRWWSRFQERLEHQVEKDRRRAPHKIAMRIPGFSDAVQEIVANEGKTYSGAATLVLERSGLWIKTPTTAAINLMRETLRDEDAATARWLTERDALGKPYGQRASTIDGRIAGCPKGMINAMLLAHALAGGRKPAREAVFVTPLGCDVDAAVKFLEDWWHTVGSHLG